MNQNFFFDQSILALPEHLLLFKINSFIFFYPCWLLLLTHTLTHLIFFVFVYMFVCLFTLQCTKQKTWKDIAAQLGIGASSSGAYTLKKHYGKNLLPFECYYAFQNFAPFHKEGKSERFHMRWGKYKSLVQLKYVSGYN